MTESYPLKWPLGRERTSSWQRKPAPFKTTPGRARDELLAELKRMGATNVVISSNVETYTRGGQTIMYANQTASKEDPGVAIYFTWKGDQYSLACDKWNNVTDNLQALNKTVDAIRGVERWGTGEMMKAAFAGFKELPEMNIKVETWWETLGIYPLAKENEIREAYRRKVMIVHPDKGGTTDLFNKVKNAYELGLSQLK